MTTANINKSTEEIVNIHKFEKGGSKVKMQWTPDKMAFYRRVVY